jgi:hypothetical protein
VAVTGPLQQGHQGGLVADLLPVLRAEGHDLVPLRQQQPEDALALGRVGGVLTVQVRRGVPAGARDGVPCLAGRAEQRRHDRHREHPEDHGQRQRGADLHDRDLLTVVDERDVVLVQRVQDQLHADEGEDRGQTVGEVDQPVQQSVDEEEQLS